MQILTDTGKNLDVIIITSPTKNWETFGTWYSINKNIPEAKVQIFCVRTKEPAFQLFQWAKRLKVPVHYINSFGDTQADMGDRIATVQNDYLNWLNVFRTAHKTVGDQVLAVSPLTMVIQPFPDEVLCLLNGQPFKWIGENAWFCKKIVLEEFEKAINDYYLTNTIAFKNNALPLCFDAKTTKDLKTIVNYKKGCGRWIDTARGCPFANAAGLVSDEMTPNEKAIVELWDRMVPIFNIAV